MEECQVQCTADFVFDQCGCLETYMPNTTEGTFEESDIARFSLQTMSKFQSQDVENVDQSLISRFP